MEKKEEGITLEGHKIKLITKDPQEKAMERKRVDKLNSMRIAMTYIENTRKTDVTPEEAIEIADKFLTWLEKK